MIMAFSKSMIATHLNKITVCIAITINHKLKQVHKNVVIKITKLLKIKLVHALRYNQTIDY